MAEIKTKVTKADVSEFITMNAGTTQRRQDSFELLRIMQQITGFAPQMWGTSIIGFGSYHYKSEKSRQEGDWPLVGFSPRKTAISLYIYAGAPGQDILLKSLGKCKMGKSCIYIQQLSDINLDAFASIIQSTIKHLEEKYGKY